MAPKATIGPFLLASIVCLSYSEGCCPEKFMRVGEDCYYYSGMKKNWHDADYHCRILGANLVSIHSSTESQFIYNLWKGLVQESTAGDNPGTSIESFTREQRKEGNLKRSQPYLLGIGSRRLPTQFFVIIDERAIPCGGDVTSAVDVMFKLHFVFNIHYATELKAFYAFLEHYVYEVGLPKDVIPARASELMSSIMAISSNK